mmetsp:Transcript_3305/g.5313  ORF Transcript_3305/g.5313 Transcript_3305/m.5313 type:complete len:223 (-) Transcript_3305:1320-1988(-)
MSGKCMALWPCMPLCTPLPAVLALRGRISPELRGESGGVTGRRRARRRSRRSSANFLARAVRATPAQNSAHTIQQQQTAPTIINASPTSPRPSTDTPNPCPSAVSPRRGGIFGTGRKMSEPMGGEVGAGTTSCHIGTAVSQRPPEKPRSQMQRPLTQRPLAPHSQHTLLYDGHATSLPDGAGTTCSARGHATVSPPMFSVSVLPLHVYVKQCAVKSPPVAPA